MCKAQGWDWKQEVSRKSTVPCVEACIFTLTPPATLLSAPSYPGQVLQTQHSQEPRAGAGLEGASPDTGGGSCSGKGFLAELASEYRTRRRLFSVQKTATVETQKEDKAASLLGEIGAAPRGSKSEQEVRRSGREAGYREREKKITSAVTSG